jgi:nitroreductase
MGDPFWRLVEAGALAPSGDNTQPWRFDVDPARGRISVSVDEARDPSPMNAGQRMARLAVGAALENMLQAARASGWPARVEAADPPAVVALRLEGRPAGGVLIPQAVAARATNRRRYDGGPVPPEALAAVRRAVPDLPGVTARWVTDRARLGALARLVGRADALLFAERPMRRAFLGTVRFDRPARADITTGLSVGSLELSPGELVGLRLMRRLPGWLLRAGGAFRALGARARRLVESSSGVCLITAEGRDEATDVAVGRVMQAAWLALTAHGLAAQPVMSLPVLANVLENGPPPLRASLGGAGVPGLLEGVTSAVPEAGGGRLAALVRFGHAAAPSHRVGRLPVRPDDPGGRPGGGEGGGPW